MKAASTLLALLLWTNVASAEIPPSWTRAVDPVRVAGNIYYVGTEELGSYLIAGKEGLVLLDVPMDENAALVLRNVQKLGFDPRQIRVLLGSHAHLDHIGGFAAVKEKTGARVLLSKADAELAARGGKNDFAFGDTLAYPPVTADAFIEDGQVVRVGDVAMTAMLTPGHTRGCTTWRTTVRENGKPLDVVFLCSVSAPGYTLVDNEKYPGIMDDYRHTFATLRKVHPDVFLANHASFFGLAGKLAGAAKGGKRNPFVVPGEFETFLDRAWKSLQDAEAKQRSH